jgi:heme O synthase-like polyprenyltransferase
MLVASGTATLNQYVERRFDAQMRRTKRRPLAARRIEPSRALCFGIKLSVFGAIYLAAAVNLLASLLAVLTLLSYLLIYTPLRDAAMHLGGGVSGGSASADRLGGSIRKIGLSGVGALRHGLSLAIPAFYGYCVDVP